MDAESPQPMKACPVCGENILAVAKKCRYCGEYLDPELRKQAHTADLGDAMLMPVGRPASAIAAGYLGLISVIPPFGIIAIITSVVALRTLKANPEMLGRGRAWFGLIMGMLCTLVYAIPIVVMIVNPHGR